MKQFKRNIDFLLVVFIIYSLTYPSFVNKLANIVNSKPSNKLLYSTVGENSDDLIKPMVSELNPEYLEYLSNKNKFTLDLFENKTGFIPSPLDKSIANQFNAYNFPNNYSATIPQTFNLNDLGKISSIKDQGQLGTCWAFATYSSLESTQLPNNKYDFSELNLHNNHGFDFAEGGNFDMSTAYLARWDGPINETDDPYSDKAPASPSGLLPIGHLEEVLWLSERSNYTDNNEIKSAIMDYGAVGVYYYHNYVYYNSTSKSYYYNAGTSANHAVAIVGWDDNYSRDNFTNKPAGNGAFIVKNSWGTTFGNNGFFYISYYDTSLSGFTVFNNLSSDKNYDNLYQYDELGVTSSYGYGSDTAWAANVFQANDFEDIKATSFYTMSPNTSYEIKVYINSTTGPTSGTLKTTQTGTLKFAGYHTVDLLSPVPVTSGQKFSIVVKFVTPSYDYPIPIERKFASYSSNAAANPNESYLSTNGSNWSDLTSVDTSANVCIKAFTDGNNTPRIAFSDNSFTTNENDTKATITVKRYGSLSGSASVNYMTNNGTATSGVNFTETKGEVAFASEEAIKVVEIPIIDNTTYKGNKTLNINLSDPVNTNLGSLNEAIIKIIDDETPNIKKLKAETKGIKLAIGGTQEAVLTVIYLDKETGTLDNTNAVWESSDADVATVSDSGVITAISFGSAKITANFAGKNVKISVSTKFKLTPDVKSMKLGLTSGLNIDDISLIATFADKSTKDVSYNATWESSDPSIAMVLNGIIIALDAGKTTITATYKTKAVKISVDTRVKKLESNQKSIKLNIGSSSAATITAKFADDNIASVTSLSQWTTSNEAVATVSGGLITIKGSGSAKITATYKNKSVKISVKGL